MHLGIGLSINGQRRRRGGGPPGPVWQISEDGHEVIASPAVSSSFTFTDLGDGTVTVEE